MKTKRSIVTFLLVGLMIFSVACSSNSNSSNSSNNNQSNSSAKSNNTKGETKKPVTLKVLMNTEWIEGRKLQFFIDAYEEETGNKLDVQSVPDGQYSNLVNTRLATRDLPDVLFYWGEGAKGALLQPEKNFAELTDEEMITRVVSVVKDDLAAMGQGKIYGLPVTTLNVTGIIYNKDVFAEHQIEIPHTHEELLAAAEKLKTAGVTPFYDAGKDAWPLQVYTLGAFSNIIKKQPDVLDKINTNQLKFTDLPEYEKMLAAQLEIHEKGYTNSDLFSATYDMSIEQVATGKSAMIVNADWAIPIILERFPNAPIGMFPVPWDGEGDNYTGYLPPIVAYAIKDSKNEAAAVEFLRFIADPDRQNEYNNLIKGIPSFSGVEAELNPGTAEMYTLLEQGNARVSFNSGVRYTFPDYEFLMQDLYGGKKTPAEVAQVVQQRMEETAKNAGAAEFTN
ncbi:ABC transporter substrate-binding protein [Paenibacillus yanchengensis]|uniref:ABC transporter substrate-binding protein n=1 Tax=Paenibacillus yanchengensis TaxID=2035833 RepID=A0ABW4YJC9_9BACL